MLVLLHPVVLHPTIPDTLKPRHDLATGYAEAARTAVAIWFPEQMLNDRERCWAAGIRAP
jgi:hypothetical protein